MNNEAVILNENIDPGEPGDVSVFRSAQRAAEYLEAIDVEDGVYAGWTLDGAPLQLSTRGEQVIISVDETAERDPEQVRRLLTYSYAHLRRAKPVDTVSLDEMIKALGYTY